MTDERRSSGDGSAPVWQPEIEEIQRRRELAAQMGGPETVKRQHESGRLTARERIDLLLDAGTFQEIGAFAGAARYDESGRLVSVTPANVVIGKGRIGGMDVVVSADDFTVRGGSSEATSPEKWQYAERLALDYQMPLVRLVETAGGSINLLEKAQATKIPGYPHWAMTEMLGIIPVVGVALGPCAGFGAVRVIASHFSVMARGTSQVFAAGPAVVGPGIGEDVTKEDLGGAAVHARGSGVVDNEAENEPDALDQARRFLSYLPPSVYQPAPRRQTDDRPDRQDEGLASIVPRDRRKLYRMRRILDAVFDTGSLFEIGRHQGASIITMLGRLDGYPVGLMANDPYVWGGSMTDGAADKVVHFVDLCDTFHLPVVNFMDQPGVTVGRQAEARGTVRKAIRALNAIDQASVPWCAVFIRRAFGVAGAGYGPLKTTVRYAWPSAHWGSIPVEGGVEAAYKRDIAATPNPAARRAELVAHFRPIESPFRTAERFGIEDIVDPRTTRPLLCRWVSEAYRVLPRHLGVTRRSMRV